MCVRTERDSSEERKNDRPPCKIGNDAQLAHFDQNLGGIGMICLASQKQAAKVQSKLIKLRARIWVKG
jgi:hypothetical protein